MGLVVGFERVFKPVGRAVGLAIDDGRHAATTQAAKVALYKACVVEGEVRVRAAR